MASHTIILCTWHIRNRENKITTPNVSNGLGTLYGMSPAIDLHIITNSMLYPLINNENLGINQNDYLVLICNKTRIGGPHNASCRPSTNHIIVKCHVFITASCETENVYRTNSKNIFVSYANTINKT